MALTPEEKAAAKAAKDAAKASIALEGDTISVEFAGGVREFSLEIHGDTFRDLAAEFAETNHGTVL